MTSHTLPVEYQPGLRHGADVVITTCGTLHGELPPLTRPAVVVDLRTALRNPADNPGLIEMTGLDAAVRDHVLNTPGVHGIVADTTARILGAHSRAGRLRQDAIVLCRGGRHRSVVVAEMSAARLRIHGLRVEVEHHDIDKPVVRNATTLA